MNDTGVAVGNSATASGERRFGIEPPQINLPKGGGAIRGIGEKFSSNPVTGTGALSVPIFTSPSRSGFGPQLTLSYDSGAGNGPFGFGWRLSLPSITRKTDKGLPRYYDAVESDVFILSDAEDLVPVLVQQGSDWQRPRDVSRTAFGKKYLIRQYRPRIEGLFARIERWTSQSDPTDVFWRSISRDNVTTWYGRDELSRIFDPTDPTRIFSWLICQSYDDKGNAIVYDYLKEDSRRILENPAGQIVPLAHELNRSDVSRSANRYLKRVIYGNRAPNRDPKTAQAIDPRQLPGDTWMFELLFDYGEGHYTENQPDAQGLVFVSAQLFASIGSYWPVRQDPFSTYRSSFELRTYRLCRRALMFHHFSTELGINDCLVCSTEFSYDESPINSLITRVTQSGYLHQPTATATNRYLKKSLPQLQLEYSGVPDAQQLALQPIQEVEAESLENLPYGLDGGPYQWIDLDGAGVHGILSGQGGAWFYKRNLSPINPVDAGDGHAVAAKFAPDVVIASQPALVGAGGHQHLLDLAGDGSVDLVEFGGAAPGFYERAARGAWSGFTAFRSLPVVDWNDPNLKFIDLTGDGLADILITEEQVFRWHSSFGEGGFGEEERVRQPTDEEQGPAVIFADSTESIFLADLSGDGLTDIVRIRNGQIAYWPNLGGARFGPKIEMDNAPWLEAPELFDGRRIRLADIDGSGTIDLVYLASDGARVYFNQCGNGWSDPVALHQFPPFNDLDSVAVVDLLGAGTACLVWSSPLPGDVRSAMRYIDLMGGEKPHLLRRISNNLGAETEIQYAPSTKFYLQDEAAGQRWVTRLPFPVHCVERVISRDLISRSVFVTSYTYHEGYFDGPEREFRGFGMVEQRDAEIISVTPGRETAGAANVDSATHVPPTVTKTWFHTGAFLQGDSVSRHFRHNYYQEWRSGGGSANFTPQQRASMVLADTLWPNSILRADGTRPTYQLTGEEAQEVARALKGSILRQEIYGLDQTEAANRPYSVSERNYTIELLQPKGRNRHAVAFCHPRETIDFHYERKLYTIGAETLADPRVSHNMVLTVDPYGNVTRSVAIGYGRRRESMDTRLTQVDKDAQRRTRITLSENSYTKPIDNADDDFRAPQICDACVYELLQLTPGGKLANVTNLFDFDALGSAVAALADGHGDLAYEQWNVDETTLPGPSRRPIGRQRNLYYQDDLSGPAPLGESGTRGLPYEAYKLAFTASLLGSVYMRGTENLLQPAATVLGPEGGYVLSDDLIGRGWFSASDSKGEWWIPSGQGLFSPVPGSPTLPKPPQPLTQDITFAFAHFFTQRAVRDPFGSLTRVEYDNYDLLMSSTRDAVGNQTQVQNDYRILRPALITDANGNRSEARSDALGLVCGTAVMGKTGETLGDSFATFSVDLTPQQIADFLADPKSKAAGLLGTATTRFVYDLDAYARWKTQGPPGSQPPPAVAATLARETHGSDLAKGQTPKIQVNFSYSDGFGREVQKKIPAEPATASPTTPRWVGSGWTIFNNKGKPVLQFEPFFTATHQFEFAMQVGVSTRLFYDPAQRVIGKLHPNHTWEKIVIDPWYQESWDVNDTIRLDPKTDETLGAFFVRLSDAEYLPTWYTQRIGGAKEADEQAAAQKTNLHAGTPLVTHFDTLGRTFLTIAHNRATAGGADEFLPTRLMLDIEGRQRVVRDAHVDATSSLGRAVMRYDYDVAGNRVHQSSMEGGERWMLNDVTGKPIRGWDGPRQTGEAGRTFRTEYDELRRPLRSYVQGFDPSDPTKKLLYQRTVYGESHPDSNSSGGAAAALNLNLRGKTYLAADMAGVLISDRFDFKGNLTNAHRRLTSSYKSAPDWSSAEPRFAATILDPTLLDAALGGLTETETFTTSTSYDALNRPIAMTTPDQSVTLPEYNEANLLERISVKLRGAANATLFVGNLDYDAKGQRELIEYGNGTSTSYQYDPLTFRLTRIETTRPADTSAVAQQIFASSDTVQKLSYTYDPAGNLTRIADDALQTVVYAGQTVKPVCEYTYDAIYRLIEATGREHFAQSGVLNPMDGNYRDHPFVGFRDQNDLKALRNYTESYAYDAVGNIATLTHSPAGGNNWVRTYTYNEPSQLETGVKSNRLTSTSIAAGSTPPVENYAHDGHGNIVAMPHLSVMQWDFMDRLGATSRQVVNNATTPPTKTPETTYYVYDASGQRVRKVTENQLGVKKNERLYLGGCEFYREYGVGSLLLERQSQHVMDDKQRVALVETLTINNGNAIANPVLAQRYQLGNHLGSVSLELDENAGIVTYEEYTPYGNAAFQGGRTAAEVSLKRYRYVAKERDAETGFSYHGARYYLCWLGRWANCDPGGTSDGTDLYIYSASNPIGLLDTDGKSATRFWGAVQALGGAAQLIGGVAIFTQAEIPVGAQALGVAMVFHGYDDFKTGWKKLVTGEETENDTYAAARSVARVFTRSEAKADASARTFDMFLGFLSPSGPAGSGPKLAPALATTTGHVVEATAHSPEALRPLLAVQMAGATSKTTGGGKSLESSKEGDQTPPDKSQYNVEEHRAAEFEQRAQATGTVPEQIELWIEKTDKEGTYLEKTRSIFDAANTQKKTLLEWTTPRQLSLTAPSEGKWDQLIARIGIFQEAKAKGWRVHGWSQSARRYIGDVTDWQQKTTKYPHWNWPKGFDPSSWAHSPNPDKVPPR